MVVSCKDGQLRVKQHLQPTENYIKVQVKIYFEHDTAHLFTRPTCTPTLGYSSFMTMDMCWPTLPRISTQTLVNSISPQSLSHSTIPGHPGVFNQNHWHHKAGNHKHCPDVTVSANKNSTKCHTQHLHHGQIHGPPQTDPLPVQTCSIYDEHLLCQPERGNGQLLCGLATVHLPLLLELQGTHPLQQRVDVSHKEIMVPQIGKLEIQYLKHFHDLISLRVWSATLQRRPLPWTVVPSSDAKTPSMFTSQSALVLFFFVPHQLSMSTVAAHSASLSPMDYTRMTMQLDHFSYLVHLCPTFPVALEQPFHDFAHLRLTLPVVPHHHHTTCTVWDPLYRQTWVSGPVLGHTRTMERVWRDKRGKYTITMGLAFHFTNFTHAHIHRATMFAVVNHCRVQQVTESDTMVGRLHLNEQFLIR